jgi:hypothetical protein
VARCEASPGSWDGRRRHTTVLTERQRLLARGGDIGLSVVSFASLSGGAMAEGEGYLLDAANGGWEPQDRAAVAQVTAISTLSAISSTARSAMRASRFAGVGSPTGRNTRSPLEKGSPDSAHVPAAEASVSSQRCSL